VSEVAVRSHAIADGGANPCRTDAEATERQWHGTAVGSAALADPLTGHRRPWRVMGVSTHVWWCASEDTILVVTDDRAVRLPNAVIVDPGPAVAPGTVSPGDLVSVGASSVATPRACWRVVRWWDPRVAPVDADPSDVVRLLRAAARLMKLDHEEPLIATLRVGDHHRVVEQAGRLIGSGVGLTPEGDDFLAGAIAGHRHGGDSIGNVGVSTLLDQISPWVLNAARGSTTLLSFSLLRHAFATEVAVPVGMLLRALTGRGDLPAAISATTEIGQSSGPALARGVVGGVAAACGVRL